MIIKDENLFCKNDFGGCRNNEFELDEEGFFCTECGSAVKRPRFAIKIAQKQLKDSMEDFSYIQERAQ